MTPEIQTTSCLAVAFVSRVSFSLGFALVWRMMAWPAIWFVFIVTSLLLAPLPKLPISPTSSHPTLPVPCSLFPIPAHFIPSWLLYWLYCCFCCCVVVALFVKCKHQKGFQKQQSTSSPLPDSPQFHQPPISPTIRSPIAQSKTPTALGRSDGQDGREVRGRMGRMGRTGTPAAGNPFSILFAQHWRATVTGI